MDYDYVIRISAIALLKIHNAIRILIPGSDLQTMAIDSSDIGALHFEKDH